jgi:hypothetical protein
MTNKQRAIAGASGGEEEIWQGYIEILQPDIAGAALAERGRILTYATPVNEERWFTYTADDPGKGMKKFLSIVDGSVMVLSANQTPGATLTWSSCDRNDPNAAANHASFRAGLAPHDYVNWDVAQHKPDADFLTAWNAAAVGERFKLYQGAYNAGAPTVNWVGYIVWRSTGSQHWLVFEKPGANGETKFLFVGVDPTSGNNNSGPTSSHGTLKFVAHNVTLTAADLTALPQHNYIRHLEQTWP